jgi:glycine dehydrogenase subunit 1
VVDQTRKSFVHPYIPNSVPEIKKELMKQIGIDNIEELFADIPQEFRLRKRLDLPQPASEQNVSKHVDNLLSRNRANRDMAVFLGAGCWPHYIPAVVEALVNRTEFLTSYTPYQPEASQGTLQALFEYQSMICELTAMDVATCSMYDWASALGEALRMAVRATHRTEALIPRLIHPERAETLRTYMEPTGVNIKSVTHDSESGQLDIAELEAKISDQTAAVYIENPTYLGFIETQGEEIANIVHDHSALFIVGVDPISLGVLKPPGEYDADIVVGEGQPLGNPMNFGGPLLGIFSCRGDIQLVRQMPGRIVGMTTTLSDERKGFCMALQTREQHIRRERATSNICTDESLCAVAAAAYLALLGPHGLKQLGEHIMNKADYAMQLLAKIEGVKTPMFKSTHFKEFTVSFDGAKKTVHDVHKALLQHQIQGGKDISREFPELGETALYCVTEVHSKEDIDHLATTLEAVLNGGGS